MTICEQIINGYRCTSIATEQDLDKMDYCSKHYLKDVSEIEERIKYLEEQVTELYTAKSE